MRSSAIPEPRHEHRSMDLFLGVALASVVFFVWSAISWMALPWQRRLFKEFRDESTMAQVFEEQTTKSGIYGLPGEPRYPEGATREQRTAIDQRAWERLQRGPLVFAVVAREGFSSYPRMLALAFLGNVLVSLAFGWMLGQTVGLSYAERVAFLVVASLAAGIACRVPDWNWHKFPLEHALVNIASLAVGWLLSGLVLAHFVRGQA
jgi:hypothetical protein